MRAEKKKTKRNDMLSRTCFKIIQCGVELKQLTSCLSCMMDTRRLIKTLSVSFVDFKSSIRKSWSKKHERNPTEKQKCSSLHEEDFKLIMQLL